MKFSQRVEACPALQTPEDLEIVPTVGKCHLSAHKLECFPRFSLMFIRGSGHIDGEILETLWAPFNKILTTARSMSLAHRQGWRAHQEIGEEEIIHYNHWRGFDNG